MLERVLEFIHNYFEKEKHRGAFAIESNTISLLFLKEGQYFRIVGSDLNDGVYQYPPHDLMDEEFEGEIWALSIPRSVLTLVGEIEAWQDQYGAASDSPYQSESFGGYSYAKGGGSSDGTGLDGWQAKFAMRLNAWRKIG